MLVFLGIQGCLWYALVLLLLLASEPVVSASPPGEVHLEPLQLGANAGGCSEVLGSLTPEASIALGKMWLFLMAQAKGNVRPFWGLAPNPFGDSRLAGAGGEKSGSTFREMLAQPWSKRFIPGAAPVRSQAGEEHFLSKFMDPAVDAAEQPGLNDRKVFFNVSSHSPFKGSI